MRADTNLGRSYTSGGNWTESRHEEAGFDTTNCGSRGLLHKPPRVTVVETTYFTSRAMARVIASSATVHSADGITRSARRIARASARGAGDHARAVGRVIDAFLSA